MLTELSTQLADTVRMAAASVVQVHGHARPASGVVYGAEAVLTTARAVGREERPRVRDGSGNEREAELGGWDPATRLVLLKVPGLAAPAIPPGSPPRVGELAIAVGRSWSNSVTATIGLVSVVGGPLHTARRRTIEEVIRTSAPMHEGFAGGALLGADGRLLGVATAASIRGLGVVIPAAIAWKTAADMATRGSLRRGYLGIAAHPVRVTGTQSASAGAERALLVVDVKPGTPAAEAGLFVGDLLLSLDGEHLTSPEDLFDLLVGERVGRPVGIRVLRGDATIDVTATLAER